MILVVGATGTNGREVVHRLADSGRAVRALVRNPARAGDLQRPGVEIAAGELDDVASLNAALEGVDHAFLVTAVDPRDVEWIGNFVGAAKRSGSPHVVKFSAMGADAGSPVELLRQHGESDVLIVGSGLPYTILQPNSFFQNMFWSSGTIKDHGAFYLPVGDARQSQLDVRDIASVAVKVLTEPGHEGMTYELTGPEALTFHEIADHLSKATGKPIRYVPVTRAAAEESMRKSGMPDWNVRAVGELYDFFASGQAARVSYVIERVTGRTPIRFEQFARDFASAFA
jgi:uncharacterized protein YbjT (DUF2867 family)